MDDYFFLQDKIKVLLALKRANDEYFKGAYLSDYAYLINNYPFITRDETQLKNFLSALKSDGLVEINQYQFYRINENGINHIVELEPEFPKLRAYALFEVLMKTTFKENPKTWIRVYKHLNSRGYNVDPQTKVEFESIIDLAFEETDNMSPDDISIKLSLKGKKYLNGFTTTKKLMEDLDKEKAKIDQSTHFHGPVTDSAIATGQPLMLP